MSIPFNDFQACRPIRQMSISVHVDEWPVMVTRRLPDLHDVPYDTPSSSGTFMSVTPPATLIEDVHANEQLYANSTLISSATPAGECAYKYVYFNFYTSPIKHVNYKSKVEMYIDEDN